jgi:hypothetical protein
MPARMPARSLDTTLLRRASGVGDAFPYDGQRVTFILIKNGAVTQAKTRAQKRNALAEAMTEGAILLAAWPGEWSQDIFVVDDLDAAIADVG